MVTVFNRFLLIILVSFSGLFAKGLYEIAHLPHAQALITKVFKERGLDPKDFEFTFYNKKGDNWLYYPGINGFSFDLCDLEKVNDTMNSPDSLYQLINCGRFGLKSRREHLLSTQGFIGHELQHACDRAAIIYLYSSGKNSDELTEELKKLEARADLFCSSNPEVLRALARSFKYAYEQVRLLTFSGNHEACTMYLTKIDPIHPTLIQRYHYLSAAAAQLEQEGYDFT